MSKAGADIFLRTCILGLLGFLLLLMDKQSIWMRLFQRLENQPLKKKSYARGCFKNPETGLLIVICSEHYFRGCTFCQKTDAAVSQQSLCKKRFTWVSGWLLPLLLWKWWVEMKQWSSRRRNCFQAVVIFSVLFDANSVAKIKFLCGTRRSTRKEHLASHMRKSENLPLNQNVNNI